MKVNIHDAKTHLSAYLAQLQAGGEPIIICNRNEPIAEIRAIEKKVKKPRSLGFAKGEFTIPDSFFDPLPEELIKAFEGE
jgi:prevent-host-death family protein